MSATSLDELEAQAMLLLQEGDMPACAARCRDALAAHPEHPGFNYLHGVIAFTLGDDVEGIERLTRAFAAEPEDIRFNGALCDVYLTLGDAEQAIPHLRRAIDQVGDDAGLLVTLADTLLAAERPGDALAYYRRALAIEPDAAAALNGLGAALVATGNMAEAVHCFDAVLATTPDDPIALMRKGGIETTGGRLDQAEALLARARELAPDTAELHRHLGELYTRRGRTHEAVAAACREQELSHDLVQLAQRYRTDKWGAHFYARHYHTHFHALRTRALNLLEIGVGGYENPKGGGASLRMWKAFFPNANIYAIDIHDKQAVEEERIRIFRGSQDDPAFLHRVAAEIGRIDIIIDDGSHVNAHVLSAFQTLFPLLTDDGIYAVEDTQTAYWPDYGGTSTQADHPDSMLTLFKTLTDGLNHAERLLPGYTPSYLDRHVVSVHFYHNLVIVHKGHNDEGSNSVRDGAL